MTHNEDCYVKPAEVTPDMAALSNAMYAYMAISGLGCVNCANRVRNGLLAIDGVHLAEVSLQNGWAAVAYDPMRVTTIQLLLDSVARIGHESNHHYEARLLHDRPMHQIIP